MRDIQSEGTKALDQAEHNSDANAKRVVIRAQDPDTGDFVNISAVDSGGTFGLATTDRALATRIDDTTTANTTYIGKAPIGSSTSVEVWQIAKLDTSSGLVKTWAAGSSAFNQAWNDRETITYS